MLIQAVPVPLPPDAVPAADAVWQRAVALLRRPSTGAAPGAWQCPRTLLIHSARRRRWRPALTTRHDGHRAKKLVCVPAVFTLVQAVAAWPVVLPVHVTAVFDWLLAELRRLTAASAADAAAYPDDLRLWWSAWADATIAVGRAATAAAAAGVHPWGSWGRHACQLGEAPCAGHGDVVARAGQSDGAPALPAAVPGGPVALLPRQHHPSRGAQPVPDDWVRLRAGLHARTARQGVPT